VAYLFVLLVGVWLVNLAVFSGIASGKWIEDWGEALA
jgi:hypothetical protein